MTVAFAIATVVASLAALALEKSLPYRIGPDDYSKYLWGVRLLCISLGLAAVTLILAATINKVWPIGIAMLSLGVMAVGAVGWGGGPHSGPSPENWCYNNIRWMDQAKELLTEKRDLTNGTQVTIAQILPLMPTGVREVRCTKGGKYIIGPIGEEPRCTVHGSQAELRKTFPPFTAVIAFHDHSRRYQ